MYANNLIQQAIEYGIIDLATVCNQVENLKKETILNNYDYSIWQGKNGKWYTKLPLQNGERRLVKRSKKEDVQKVIIEHYSGNPLMSTKPTFKEVFLKWLDNKIKLQEICEGTYDRYINDFEKCFKGTEFYNAHIDIITEEDLEDFIRQRIVDLHMSAKAYGNMRTLIIGTFKYAKKQKWTDISISSFFGDLDISRRVFTRKRKIDEEQVFTEEEVSKIVEWLKDNPSVENYGLLLIFQCGLRTAELSALKFDDVKGNILHIQRQEIKYKDKSKKGKVIHEIVDYTKTENSDRKIYLPRSALDTIDKLRALNPNNEYMMMIGNRKILTNTFNDRLYKACDSVGIPRRSMHKIRKTYGTILLDSGADESFVKAQMGHSDITTTRQYYYYSNKNDNYKLEQIERAIQF